MGPTFTLIKKKLKKQMKKEMRSLLWQNIRQVRDFNFFFLSKLLSSIHGVPTVGFRRVKHEKCSTRLGLRVGTKKKGISLRIQIKIRKNPSF